MNTITRLVVYLIISLSTVATTYAQDTKTDSTKATSNQYKIEALKDLKKKIEKEEREFLKQEIESINQRLDAKDITAAEAEDLKKKAAQKRAANIENRLAIIDNKIALLGRNESGYETENDVDGYFSIKFGDDDDEWTAVRFGRKNKPRK